MLPSELVSDVLSRWSCYSVLALSQKRMWCLSLQEQELEPEVWPLA